MKSHDRNLSQAEIQTMSHDMIKLQLSEHFCCVTKIFLSETSFISYWSDIML